jgi:hypothetical protein
MIRAARLPGAALAAHARKESLSGGRARAASWPRAILDRAIFSRYRARRGPEGGFGRSIPTPAAPPDRVGQVFPAWWQRLQEAMRPRCAPQVHVSRGGGSSARSRARGRVRRRAVDVWGGANLQVARRRRHDAGGHPAAGSISGTERESSPLVLLWTLSRDRKPQVRATEPSKLAIERVPECRPYTTLRELKGLQRVLAERQGRVGVLSLDGYLVGRSPAPCRIAILGRNEEGGLRA